MFFKAILDLNSEKNSEYCKLKLNGLKEATRHSKRYDIADIQTASVKVKKRFQ